MLDFDETLIFSTYFRKVLISDFMKIRSVGAELFMRTIRQTRTDMMKLIVAFCNFANAPKSSQRVLCFHDHHRVSLMCVV